MTEKVLELKNITKSFPGVKALDNMKFDLNPGEIHVLMGENGAGKSTFIKIITGVHEYDEGEMYLNGEKVFFSGPLDAQKNGIAAIYQHATFYPHLNVTENIFIGHEKVSPRTKRLLWKEMREEARALLKRLGGEFDPNDEVGTLSVAQQQIVEIAKALSTNAQIIVMDEPTAALTNRESEQLYEIADQLRKEGKSIIFISHRFEDMYRLGDRVTILRDSKYINTWEIKDVNNEKLIMAMVGREISELFPSRQTKIGEKLLEVKNISRKGYFKDINFDVRRGEVLGLTGLVGAGRSEVCQALFGIEVIEKGDVYLRGEKVKITSPMKAMKLGIGYLPEDRQLQGLILQWEIGKNISLPALGKLSKKNMLVSKNEDDMASKLAEKLHVKSPSIFNLVSSLSGGNQQKVVFAKLLTRDIEVIILDEPTKGVDVGAKTAIYNIINELTDEGYGVIMISSEMPEVIGMSDRIAVMCEGRISKIFDHDNVTQEGILQAAMSYRDSKEEPSMV